MSARKQAKERKEKPLNDRQRRFCEHVVKGHPAGRAYELAGFTARGNTAETNAARMLRKAQVFEYLQKLREAASKRAGFERDDLVQFLVDVLKTPVSDVAEGSRLAQKYRIDEGGVTVEMPSKMVAAKQLADIMGWNEPEKRKLEFEVVIGGTRNE